MKFIKNISIVIFVVVIGYSPVFYFNIVDDPYAIFTSDYSKLRIEPNSHFIKMRYLLNHETKFDSYIFGNSRANNVDPTLLSNGVYFNNYYSLGVPKEHLLDISLLIKEKKKIKNIIMFFDISSYSVSTFNRENEPLRIPYAESKLKLIKNYIHYCFQVPEKKFKEDFYNAEPTAIYEGMLTSGRAINLAVENFIENNKQAHCSDPKFNNPSEVYHNMLDETIESIKSIKKICDEHKINLTFVMNPIHKTTYLASNLELYFIFQKKLAEISDFYDFSGINKVTTNNYFYYETSHYRPIIGNAMINFIQNRKSIDSMPDFGEFVKSSEIDAHIIKLKNQVGK